jgi:hypothetical protein
MPIKPENRKLYPRDWDAISLRIRRDRAHWHCEQCGAENGAQHPVTGSIVVLTVHHKDRNPAHCDDGNLIALCQACHLEADQDRHVANRRGCHQPPLPDMADALGHSELRQRNENVLGVE